MTTELEQKLDYVVEQIKLLTQKVSEIESSRVRKSAEPSLYEGVKKVREIKPNSCWRTTDVTTFNMPETTGDVIEEAEPPQGYDPRAERGFDDDMPRKGRHEREFRELLIMPVEKVEEGTVTEHCSAPGCTMKSMPRSYLCEHHTMILLNRSQGLVTEVSIHDQEIALRQKIIEKLENEANFRKISLQPQGRALVGQSIKEISCSTDGGSLVASLADHLWSLLKERNGYLFSPTSRETYFWFEQDLDVTVTKRYPDKTLDGQLTMVIAIPTVKPRG